MRAPRVLAVVLVTALSLGSAVGWPGVAILGKADAHACVCQGTTDGGGGEPGAAPEPGAGQAEQSVGGGGGSEGGLSPILPVLAGAAVVGTLLWFLVLNPWRKRRPLRKALEILDDDREESFPQAAELLNNALTAGLRRGPVADARFALAYVHARMGKLDEASGELAALVGTGIADREDLYLDLWVKVRREKHQGAAQLYDESGEQLGDFLQTHLLASIAYLKLGRASLRKREADQALRCFERLRELELLAEKVPRDVADHQVVLGIEALFDQQFANAEERFSSARGAAEQEGRSSLYPRLGLLLCEWCAAERPGPDFDQRLGEQVETARAEISPEPAGSGHEPTDREPGEQQLLLRDLLLWHAVSGLFASFHLPEGGGPPPEGWGESRVRFGRVRELAPDMGDPDLLDGLLTYYLAADEGERARGVELLEQALEKGVNVPEVNLLVERERQLAEAADKSVEHFLAVVRNYLGERSVPLELRRQLQERLSRLERFKPLSEVDVEQGEGSLTPSVDDLHGRGELMHRRVARIVRPRLPRAASAEAVEVDRILGELDDATTSLSKTAQALEKSEHDLMLVTGEFLLNEEESIEGDAEPGSEKAPSGDRPVEEE